MSKDTLLARVWPNLVVEENNLQVQISTLRRVLDERNAGRTFLVTVPGRGYRLIGTTAGRSREDAKPGPAVPDKPSIAVIPFANMSDDPEQEYFADGIVEDIITALSRIRWLFVIARNSSFAYKGRSVDIKQVGAELGVRYVLEGGVRKAANRVRITGQLIDASTGAHLWAERFDGALDDIFDLQDQVTSRVVGAIAPRLAAGRDRAGEAQADRQPRRVRLFSAWRCVRPPDVAGGDERGIGALRPRGRARPRVRRALRRGRPLLRRAQAERLADRPCRRHGDRPPRHIGGGIRPGRRDGARIRRARGVLRGRRFRTRAQADRPGARSQPEPRDGLVRERRGARVPRRRSRSRDRSPGPRDAPQSARPADVRHADLDGARAYLRRPLCGSRRLGREVLPGAAEPGRNAAQRRGQQRARRAPAGGRTGARPPARARSRPARARRAAIGWGPSGGRKTSHATRKECAKPAYRSGGCPGRTHRQAAGSGICNQIFAAYRRTTCL